MAVPEQAARRHDVALVLTGTGVLLLMPPFLNLFARRLLLWEIPLEVLYLFTIWAGLILAAFLFSRRSAPPRDGA